MFRKEMIPLKNESLVKEFLLLHANCAVASNAFLRAFTNLSSRPIKNDLAWSTNRSTLSCLDKNRSILCFKDASTYKKCIKY